MKPSYEQLEQELRIANEKIAKLEVLLKLALDRIAELENQIGRNSKNSSKPPPTDQKGNTNNNSQQRKKTPHVGKSRTPYPPEEVDHHSPAQEPTVHTANQHSCNFLMKHLSYGNKSSYLQFKQ